MKYVHKLTITLNIYVTPFSSVSIGDFAQEMLAGNQIPFQQEDKRIERGRIQLFSFL